MEALAELLYQKISVQSLYIYVYVSTETWKHRRSKSTCSQTSFFLVTADDLKKKSQQNHSDYETVGQTERTH